MYSGETDASSIHAFISCKSTTLGNATLITNHSNTTFECTGLATSMQLSSVQDEMDIFGNFVYKTPIEHSINNLRQETLELEVQTESAQEHLKD